MQYIPTLLGVTIWIAAVTVGAQALISHENKTQLKKMGTYIEQKAKELAIPEAEVKNIFQTETAPAQVTTVENSTKPVPTTPQAPVVSPTKERVHEEEDEDD